MTQLSSSLLHWFWLSLTCTFDDIIFLFQSVSHIPSWTRIPFLDPFLSSSLCTLFTFISGHWECCCSACSLACGFQNLCLLKYPRSGIPDHLTRFLRNLYTGQVATVRTGHATTDWFQIGKGVCQGCILSPCLLNLYAKYIMRNAGLEESQAGIKIAGRNINNLRYADDTALWQKVKN